VTAGPRSGRVGHQQRRHAGQPQRAGHGGGTRAVHEAATGEHTPRKRTITIIILKRRRGGPVACGGDVAIKRARRHVQSVRRSAPM